VWFSRGPVQDISHLLWRLQLSVVLPSHRKGLPLSSWRHKPPGKPVLGSVGDWIVAVVVDGETGLLFLWAM